MAKTGLDEFREVVTDFRDIGALAAKGAIVIPLVDLWAKLGPPPSLAVATFTSLVELLVLIWAFQFWRRLDARRLRRVMSVALFVFLIGILASILLLSSYTVPSGPGRERVVVGYRVRPDVKPLLTPEFDQDDALAAHEFDASRIWTKESLSVMRVVLPTSWVLTFASLATYIGGFVLSQRRRKLPDTAPV